MPTTALHQDADQAIPFVTVTNWVRAARLCGIDIEALFRAEGIDMAGLHPETATVKRGTMQQLMMRCIESAQQAGSPQHFPLVLGDTFAFEYLSDVETYITTSATLRDAAKALEWIPPLVNPYLRFVLAEHGHEARVSLRYELDDAPPALSWPFTEAVFATVFKFSRLLLGGQGLVGRITLRHPRHSRAEAVEAHFGVPIEWGSPVDALWFDRGLLDQPLRGAFPTLHEQAAQRLARKVAERGVPPEAAPDGDASGALVARIERAFSDKPRLMGLGLEALADELGLHARTLQRRLKEQGDTHSSIQARVRYRLAQAWLQDPRLSIEDISDRLGFSDRRSFTQAFTRWSGVTPSRYRQTSLTDA